MPIDLGGRRYVTSSRLPNEQEYSILYSIPVHRVGFLFLFSITEVVASFVCSMNYLNKMSLNIDLPVATNF